MRALQMGSIGNSHSYTHHHHHHLSLTRKGCWGTTDDFVTCFPRLSYTQTPHRPPDGLTRCLPPKLLQPLDGEIRHHIRQARDTQTSVKTDCTRILHAFNYTTALYFQSIWNVSCMQQQAMYYQPEHNQHFFFFSQISNMTCNYQLTKTNGEKHLYTLSIIHTS